MKNAYIDGSPSTPLQLSVTELEYPFFEYGNLDHSKYTRTYIQSRASFAPVAPGTEDPKRSGWYLVAHSTPERIGNGNVRFTRTFANVPEPVTRYTNVQYTRPELPTFTSALQSYGSEELENAGFIYRANNSTKTAELFTRRAVLTDSGLVTDPTGGTYAITIGTIGTASGIAYNANSGAVKAAMDAATGALALNTADIAANARGRISSDWRRPSIIIVSGTDIQWYGNRIARPAYPFPSIELVDFNLTSIEPEYQTGAIEIVNEREPEVFNLGPSGFKITPPIWSFRVPTNTTRVYRGGTVTGGTITFSVNGVTLAPITFTPDDLAGFANAVNEAIADELGAPYAFMAVPKVVQDRYESGVKNSDIEKDESWFSTREYSWREFKCTLFLPLNGGAEIKQPLPATYSWKMSYASLGGAYAGDEATFDQDSTEADVLAAFNAFQYVTDLGVTFSGIISITENEVALRPVYDVVAMVERFRLTVVSSITPTPSRVKVWPSGDYRGGYEFIIAAVYSPRLIQTARPHGLTNGEKIVVTRGSSYVIQKAEFEVIDTTTIQVSPLSDPWNDGTTITQIGRYIATYQPGTGTYRAKDVTTYWMPGVSPDFDGPEDIPLEQSVITDDQFIDYHFRDRNTSNYMLIESGGVEYYLGSMITQKNRYIDLR